MNINEFEVTDRQSFVEFLQLLHEDLYEDKSVWKVRRLDDFIAVMLDCAREGYWDFYGRPISQRAVNEEVVSWKAVGDLFKEARNYDLRGPWLN